MERNTGLAVYRLVVARALPEKSVTLSTMKSVPCLATLRNLTLTLVLGAMAGCASYTARQHAHSLELAQQDDAGCQAQGWRYPAPRYVTCRLYLQDARQHRDWMNLQLMHQTQAQPTGIPSAYPYQQIYRPLERDHFSCRLSHEAGQDYVLCGEDERGSGAQG